jgi:spore coat protein A
MQLSRRDVLKFGVLGSAALVLPLERVARTKLAEANRLDGRTVPQFVLDFNRGTVIDPVPKTITLSDTGAKMTVDYYEIRQQAATLQILPTRTAAGAPTGFRPTTIWGYNGITPGPIVKVDAGREVVMRQSNALPDHPTLLYHPATSTHLHGSASLPQFDGYANDITPQGFTKYYQYPDFQHARTLWYHDHGVHQTAMNAYMGLAAQYHLHDPFERAHLPQGEFDVPLTIKDAIFGTDGQLIFDNNSESSLMGDVILINGVPWPRMKVKKRTYRFRVLNASVSRSYRLALSNGQPMTVVATDGGLVPVPMSVTQLRVGMAERYEIVIDFSKLGTGQQVILRDLGLPNNVRFASTANLMMFEVVADAPDMTNSVIPPVLESDETMDLRPRDAVRRRRMEFRRDNGHWTVNGRIWDDIVNSGFTLLEANPGLGDVEIWELVNKSGGWFHPIHIHLVDFQIIDRNGRPPFTFEAGPKDTAYVGENETVRVLMRFGPQRGRYMMHCHNLVHEDHDMMVQFRVDDANNAAEFDPINAAKPEPTATIAAVENYTHFHSDAPASGGV